MEWLLIEASHIKVHPHAVAAKWENEAMAKTKGGLNSKIHLVVGAHGLPIRIKITHGTTADCTQALDLIWNLNADAFLVAVQFRANIMWLKII